MSETIYEEDGDNEFASHFGADAGNPSNSNHPRHKNHVHFAIPRWVFVSSLIIIILGIFGAVSWKMGWLSGAMSWYSGASVTLTVVEKDTHHAVAGAAVSIGEKTSQTNAQGIAEVKDLHSGVATISVSKAGYTAKSYTATIYRGQNPLPDVIVEKAPDKVYTFSVTVKDAIAGSGIKAAKVLIGKVELTTPESGVINVTVKEVVDSAHVTKDGFESKEVPLVFVKDNYQNVTAELMPIRYIVFEQEKGGTTDLYTTDFKASTPAKLTNGNGQYSNSDPKLSPDSKYLSFLSNRDGFTSNNARASVLYVMDEKGTSVKATDDLNPNIMRWANTSTIIYYYNVTTGSVVQPTVVSYNVISKKRTVLSQTFVDPAQYISLTHLTVANDGLTVAYALGAVDSNGSAVDLTGIYTVKTDGSARKQISKTTKTITDMYFGSDGSVKYSYMDGVIRHIYVAGSSGEKDVTNTPTVRERAFTEITNKDQNSLTALTKDGRYVYIDTKNGKSDVFLLSPDGKTESQLTSIGNVSAILLSADEKYVLVSDVNNVSYVCGLSSTNAVKLADAFNQNASFMFKPQTASP